MSDEDQPGGMNGDDSAPGGQTPEAEGWVEVVTVADEGGRGVYLTCGADVSPADLVEAALDLLGQVTRAALARPQVTRAADLGLGEDVF